MALVLGTNCGLVTVTPTTDPGGTATIRDGYAGAMKVVTGAGITKITEIGWWSDNTSEEINFKVGLYSHDAGNDKPNAILYIDDTNSKGTAAGWKVVTVDWDVVAETTYWIAYQIDNTPTATRIDYSTTGGLRVSFLAAATLPATWGASSESADYLNAIYAIVAAVTYSELTGTIAGVGAASGNLVMTLVSELSGTIAGVGAMSGNLGSTVVGMDVPTSYYKRLVVAGKDSIWYESI